MKMQERGQFVDSKGFALKVLNPLLDEEDLEVATFAMKTEM